MKRNLQQMMSTSLSKIFEKSYHNNKNFGSLRGIQSQTSQIFNHFLKICPYFSLKSAKMLLNIVFCLSFFFKFTPN